MDIREVRASRKEAHFKNNKGTWPIMSVREIGPFIIYSLARILFVICEHIKYSTIYSFIC